MRVLALDGASAAGAGFALLEQHASTLTVLRQGRVDAPGAAVRLPELVSSALSQDEPAAHLDLVAVLVGPGSFTGVRASLALAHGIALGAGSAVVGVTVGEALAPVLAEPAADRPVWCVSQARRDRVFIERITASGEVEAPVACMLDALPDPGLPILLAGNAQAVVGDVLTARGLSWQPGPSGPRPEQIATAALRRHAGELPWREAQPLYVDPPEARLPRS